MIRKMLVAAACCSVLSGCGVYMAANQPDTKDVSLFRVGVSRSTLIAEFGGPISHDERDGKKHELFKFVRGYSHGGKIGRAVMHAVFDIFTLCLWEIVATPMESALDGKDMAYEVRYDKDDVVDAVTVLKGEE